MFKLEMMNCFAGKWTGLKIKCHSISFVWIFPYLFFIIFNCLDGNVVLAQKSTSYENPLIWADFPDLSIVRHGKDYFLTSTTMHLMPGAPIMKSRDLVHWQTINYVFDSLIDNSKYSLVDGTVYGRGQWASSIRYHNGKFYYLFSPNDEPFRSYVFSTTDPSRKWTLVSRLPHFHDNSLFFDDDGKVYVFYGTGQLRELRSDLEDVKEGGVDMQIFKRDSSETGLLEGSQAIKYNGKYYLLMISWPKDGKRRQVCYRADKITGPYEKKVILESTFGGFSFVGQGCIVDDFNGNWYGLVFQDRGAVGRVPLLMPVRWKDGWPMLGTKDGKVPEAGVIKLPPYAVKQNFLLSDDFSEQNLGLNWQWNHNPVRSAWSLEERPGFLRLKTSRVVNNLYLAPNTISQRMFGPKSTAAVKIDLTHMKNGDVAGFAAFNGSSGLLEVKMNGNQKLLSMKEEVVELSEKRKAVLSVDEKVKSSININGNVIYLKITGDFRSGTDSANFYYSLDSKNWKELGGGYKMIFDYRKLFMGTRFAIYNYATIATGGFIDIDYFKVDR
ncbi:glycoside hydrolase family 43 protein [Arachidicoccus rhizosphaerae]|nr:glycoside hydrolase 43 family protein [Arachidicoccus rhizosphaerae]